MKGKEFDVHKINRAEFCNHPLCSQYWGGAHSYDKSNHRNFGLFGPNSTVISLSIQIRTTRVDSAVC